MILEFSVGNFRSIKEIQTLSFAATGLTSDKENKEVDQNNIVEVGKRKILKTIGIYGANASGKSNMLLALEYFVKAITNEASSTSNLTNLCQPFLYQNEPNKTASFFQIVLLIRGKKYRYGFTVKKNTEWKDAFKPATVVIQAEWLFGEKNIKESKYFKRQLQNIDTETLPKANLVPEIPYQYTIYLKHISAYVADSAATQIIGYLSIYFYDTLYSKHNLSHIYLRITPNKKDLTNKLFLKLLNYFGLDYSKIYLKKGFDSYKLKDVIIEKNVTDYTEHQVELNLKENESAGTQKLFNLVGVLLASFSSDYSTTILIDEIDSNFHPSLLIKLIGLFNDPQINKSNSQILFTSHDTNLMSPKIMRRDQFYFTEKLEDHSTKLYSLADLRGIRNNADFARQYLAGYYGAVPMLEDQLVLSE